MSNKKVNKRFLWLLLPLLVGFLTAQLVSASSGPPGSSDNPVITKSYADKVLKPMAEQVITLESEVRSLTEAVIRLKKPRFTDVPLDHWAYRDIEFMVQKGVISGMGEGKFGTNISARRSELAVMLVKALNLPTTGIEAEFTDVPKTHWAYTQIAAAQKAGFISGFPGGEFKPDEYVTRGQIAVMLAKAYSLQVSGQSADFKDVPKDYWAYEAIQKLADNSISKGFEDQTFRPGIAVRRAEVAILLAKAMDPARRN